MPGSWGLGGDELAGVRVDVVEVVVVVVVVVVGVLCRHLLDAGGDAPHRLHVRLRGRPALCPPPFVPSSPLGSHAPSRLSLGARGALALALGPLSSPLPVSRVPLREHIFAVSGYATLSGLRRGPESCGSRSRGSRRSSNRFLTRSEVNEALRGATSEIVGDLTQEIQAKLEPLIPPQVSPTVLGVSPNRVQANHLVAGLTNTLGSLRSRPMPTPAVILRSQFIPRTAQPPYSHVGNSTRAELDRLGLTALRAMVDVEPYGSSDLGGDPSDDEPPSMTSASPSEDDDPEDPENPSGRKKKKKRKTWRPDGRRSQKAKAIATSKIVVNLPEFTGKDLSDFAESFGRFLRMTGQTHASGRVKCDLHLQCCKTKYLKKQVKQIVTKSATFADVLVALERQYPTYETDLSIRAEIQNLAVLPSNPKPARVSDLLADLDHWAERLTPSSCSSDDLLFWLVAKLPRELWDECQ